ncbi:MAG: hypothetical protein LBV75_07025 [Paludibacter sp.]|jgi:hypothetical protein|nr:hypothetical protein [Paludibacter sp.]
MKLTKSGFAVLALTVITATIFCACEKQPIEGQPTELIITKYDGGNVEWVSIQEGLSEDAKVADAKQDRGDIVQSNDTLFIKLVNLSDSLAFTESGNFTVVLKHDKKNKMYIRFSTKFTDGLANVKWGGWFSW